MPFICLIWLLYSFALASTQHKQLEELWYERYISGSQELPHASKELIMRSRLTSRKVMSNSIRGYLRSIMWLRSTKSIARTKDIYEYWKLASVVNPLLLNVQKDGSKFLHSYLMATLFWHRIMVLSPIRSSELKTPISSKLCMFPELFMCLAEYSPVKIKKDVSVKDFHTLFNNVTDYEAKAFGKYALFSWMILIGIPQSPHNITALSQRAIMNILVENIVKDSTVRGAIRSLRQKVQTLKEECLILTVDEEFSKALKRYLLFMAWMITAMGKSKEAYELEAQVRTLVLT